MHSCAAVIKLKGTDMSLYNIHAIQYKESHFNVMKLCPGSSKYIEIHDTGKITTYIRQYKGKKKENVRKYVVSEGKVRILFDKIRAVMLSDTEEMITIDDTARYLTVTYSGTHKETLMASVGNGDDWIPSMIDRFMEEVQGRA